MTLKAATGYTPVTDPMICEICGKSVLLANVFSIKAVYALPSGTNTAFQCANEQHYACSHEHAVLALVGCLFEHLEAGAYVGKGATPLNQNYINLKNTEQSYITVNQPQPL